MIYENVSEAATTVTNALGQDRAGRTARISAYTKDPGSSYIWLSAILGI